MIENFLQLQRQIVSQPGIPSEKINQVVTYYQKTPLCNTNRPKDLQGWCQQVLGKHYPTLCQDLSILYKIIQLQVSHETTVVLWSRHELLYQIYQMDFNLLGPNKIWQCFFKEVIVLLQQGYAVEEVLKIYHTFAQQLLVLHREHVLLLEMNKKHIMLYRCSRLLPLTDFLSVVFQSIVGFSAVKSLCLSIVLGAVITIMRLFFYPSMVIAELLMRHFRYQLQRYFYVTHLNHQTLTCCALPQYIATYFTKSIRLRQLLAFYPVLVRKIVDLLLSIFIFYELTHPGRSQSQSPADFEQGSYEKSLQNLQFFVFSARYLLVEMLQQIMQKISDLLSGLFLKKYLSNNTRAIALILLVLAFDSIYASILSDNIEWSQYTFAALQTMQLLCRNFKLTGFGITMNVDLSLMQMLRCLLPNTYIDQIQMWVRADHVSPVQPVYSVLHQCRVLAVKNNQLHRPWWANILQSKVIANVTEVAGFVHCDRQQVYSLVNNATGFFMQQRFDEQPGVKWPFSFRLMTR